MNRIRVVGMGEDGPSGLVPAARQAIDEADLLIGTERLLAIVPEGRAERRATNPGTTEALEVIGANADRRRVVVLASGDPSFFGIGKVLVRHFGKERVEILPHLSSVQLAFARIGESWEDATFLSVHGRPLEGIAEAVRGAKKVAVLTDERNSPAAIALALMDAGMAEHRAYLCEDLGGTRERVREMSLADVAGMASSPLSLLVLICESLESPSHFSPPRHEDTKNRMETMGAWRHGIPDEEFYQKRPQRGLITKLEVRMAALALLGLREDSVVWDVGAGSGSVAIEAAMLARQGRVYAVERDPESVRLVEDNVERFAARNVRVVAGTAPEGLRDLPDPDAVFVGGSGGRLEGILRAAAERLRPRGRVVVSAACIETVTAATSALRDLGWHAEVTMMQVSRSKDLAGLTHLEGMNPVFLVAGRRKNDGD